MPIQENTNCSLAANASTLGLDHLFHSLGQTSVQVGEQVLLLDVEYGHLLAHQFTQRAQRLWDGKSAKMALQSSPNIHWIQVGAVCRPVHNVEVLPVRQRVQILLSHSCRVPGGIVLHETQLAIAALRPILVDRGLESLSQLPCILFTIQMALDKVPHHNTLIRHHSKNRLICAAVCTVNLQRRALNSFSEKFHTY